MKTIQVMLVVVVGLFAAGMALILTQDRSEFDPNTFEAPAWLDSLGGLAGGPRLEAHELTRRGAAFPANLRLAPGQTLQYAVARSEENVRRVTFRIVQGRNVAVEIRYQPVPGQQLGGEQAETQDWISLEQDSDTASFVVYDRGGIFRFNNPSRQPVNVIIED